MGRAPGQPAVRSTPGRDLSPLPMPRAWRRQRQKEPGLAVSRQPARFASRAPGTATWSLRRAATASTQLAWRTACGTNLPRMPELRPCDARAAQHIAAPWYPPRWLRQPSEPPSGRRSAPSVLGRGGSSRRATGASSRRAHQAHAAFAPAARTTPCRWDAGARKPIGFAVFAGRRPTSPCLARRCWSSGGSSKEPVWSSLIPSPPCLTSTPRRVRRWSRPRCGGIWSRRTPRARPPTRPRLARPPSSPPTAHRPRPSATAVARRGSSASRHCGGPSTTP
mmetsp:Transcript_162552/g.521102  ORF Transcript_162552/g.521102 Transcript_162552/m.521102 type:complete len:279 (-) Transcript_162552:1626-2462(-)